jgi:2-keto-4-pentenoate hydratase/2-oxohepta-3-ene-1,7-dioic acid hydratase in catechol pathway
VRLCTFEIRTPIGPHSRLGAVIAAGIVDLNFACARRLALKGEPRPYRLADVVLPGNMLEYLEEGSTAACSAAETLAMIEPGAAGLRGETLVYPPGQVRLLAPLPNPRSLRDFYAFEEHVRKGFEKRGEPVPPEWYEIPVYYKGGHENIIGTGEDAPWPSFTEKFDYELELAAIIGRGGRNVKAENARDYIAGFTVMNDFSARDIQRKEMKVRLGPAKGKDWCTALGPWLVTADEVGDPYSLRMTARVNGEVWSEGNSGSMFWKFEEMIEFLTRDDAIYPGDVIGSGTVGAGCGLELDRWVRPGDVIELEIEKIGVLKNRVIKATEA